LLPESEAGFHSPDNLVMGYRWAQVGLAALKLAPNPCGVLRLLLGGLELADSGV